MSSTATPTLPGQRCARGTDRSLRDAIHSQKDMRAKMPRKMPNRSPASLRRSSLIISEPHDIQTRAISAPAMPAIINDKYQSGFFFTTKQIDPIAIEI